MAGIERVGDGIRLAIAAGLAMGASACGPAVDVPDGGDSESTTEGGSTGGGGSTSTDPSASSAGGVTSSATSQSSTGSEGTSSATTPTPIYDVSVPPDTPTPVVCIEPLDLPACAVDPVLEEWETLSAVCVLADNLASCAEYDEFALFEQARECSSDCGNPQSVACESPTGPELCCYQMICDERIVPGRPFVVHGVARLPNVVSRADWSISVPLSLAELDRPTAVTLAAAWAEEGAFEVASVASFSRFVLELVSLGAPARLILDAQQALAEEVGHARVLFGLAATYGGSAVGPGPLAIEDALAMSSDPAAIAAGIAAEGCIGETVSALQLDVAAGYASDPALRARLGAIAEEELRHAELAWQTLGWLMSAGDDALRARVAQVFADGGRHVPMGTKLADRLPASVLHRHGRLTASERAGLAQRALQTLVAPAAAQLFARWTVTANRTLGLESVATPATRPSPRTEMGTFLKS